MYVRFFVSVSMHVRVCVCVCGRGGGALKGWVGRWAGV
jgi:hypothetical protein